ncbi:oocyte zinc finger protein XlCOF8.4-like isoform X2 [Drosophila willistoni]|uniref:oocyte zinc finger protein XlCOF8.4-like isoform X2 n=1 Tax=Drosophila willistoni TaxID=7260 RepID=UPI001F07E670|nr:oocyte zinc finger protein XlCOF8.4-like isoform X2 [Drosophila willistoni]
MKWEFALAETLTNDSRQKISVWATTSIKKGSLFYPFQGTIRIDKIENLHCCQRNDIRYRFGLYDEISNYYGKQVRHCNWIRFLRLSTIYDSNVNLICTKFNGDPLYEVVKTILAYQEVIVYYIPESPQENIFSGLHLKLNRQAINSILQDNPLDLSLSLMHSIPNVQISSSASEDEQKSIISDSSGSLLSLNDSFEFKASLLDQLNHTVFENCKPLNAPKIRKYQEVKKRVARNERAMLPCNICKKSFDRPSLLKRHTRTHTGEKPHVCIVCGKGFSTSSSLNTHKRIHSGEKPHQCLICGKRFTASSNLYYHRMTHIKEKPHKCNLCSKSFPTPGDLKSHMYVHSGSWPFKCSICFRGFSKQTNLRNHLFLHTGDKPHRCELCNKRFALACNLRAHMKTHEGISSNPRPLCLQRMLSLHSKLLTPLEPDPAPSKLVGGDSVNLYQHGVLQLHLNLPLLSRNRNRIRPKSGLFWTGILPSFGLGCCDRLVSFRRVPSGQ